MPTSTELQAEFNSLIEDVKELDLVTIKQNMLLENDLRDEKPEATEYNPDDLHNLMLRSRVAAYERLATGEDTDEPLWR